MTLTQLLEWESKLAGNYTDLDQKSAKALEKITITKVFTDERLKAHWSKYGLSFEQALRLRYLAQTDLYFLCHLLDKYKDITERTHREICDFFVKKQPDIKMFKEFADNYISKKERLLLVPRGGFKSSIDLADCAQWIISYPEVSILILTGVYGLACDFIKELSYHFCLEDSGATDAKKKIIYRPRNMMDGNPSWFQVLFPEHCIKPTEMRDTEFLSPASVRFGNKEASARAASIEQNLSGWHYDIMKLDDVVTNENSLTLARIEGVNKQVNVNKAMLNPYGFFDKIGTWYHESDTYGKDIEYVEKCIKDGEDYAIEIYLKAAMWPTEEAIKAGKVESEMAESDWVLWFPERLSYKFLMQEKKKDFESYAIKYMNDPRLVHQVKFPRELLIRRTLAQTQLPQQGMIVTCIDTAYSLKNWADFTVIMTALIYGGRFYIIDMVRGKFSEYELPKQIAAAALKWKPKRICVEDSVGVKWLTPELRREMAAARLNIPVEFVSLGLGTKARAKDMKAKPVVRLLGDGRLFFSLGCGGLEEIYSELEKFGKKEGAHDDIVSALSLIVDQFLSYAEYESRVNAAQHAFDNDPKERARYNMIHGVGRYSKYNANNEYDDNPVIDPNAEKYDIVNFTDHDPLADVFNN